MSQRSALTALAVAFVPTIGAARITPPSSGDVDTAQIVGIPQAMGKPAELKFDNDGEPEIASRTLNQSFLIFFYNCVKEQRPLRCRSYQFWTTFSNLNPQPTLEQINRWNETKRLAQASTNGQGNYRLKMNVNPRGADIDVSFRAYMGWWELALKEYMQHIGHTK